MVDEREIPKTGIENQEPDRDKLKLYTDIIYKQATSLLARYLPEALPEESTEIFIGITPNYLGKFKEQHYISLERDPNLDPLVQILNELLRIMEQREKQPSEFLKAYDELESERFRLIKTKAEKGESDFTDIDERINHEQELILQALANQPPEPEPKTEVQPKDWQQPEKLLQGPSQYSTGSWRDVYALVHELIHQRQAELNPVAFPVLTSPELESTDPDTTDRSKLYDLLLEAHKAQNRAEKNDSLFYPVIEGMATVGSFFVMGRYAADLARTGEVDAANKIQQIRRTLIYESVVVSKREVRAGRVNYNLNYVEGVSMMRKLYEHFGFENTPQALTVVDLTACRQIAKGSPQYQQIIQDPVLLPGLPQAA